MSSRPIVSIGAGSIVRNAHYPAYQKAGLTIHSVYDKNPEVAKSMARDFNIPNVSNSLHDAIQRAPANAVFDLAVPAQAIAETLLHLPDESAVLIQKPLGETLDQATQIRTICREKSLKAAVNFQLRTSPQALKIRELVTQKTIGEILEIDVKVTVQTPWADWEFLEKSPRMEIVYHSIHYLDFIRCLLGEPVGVKANSIKHPASPKLHSSRSVVVLDYGPQTRAQVVTYHAHNFGPSHQESQIRIEGTEGCIVYQMGLNMDYPGGVGDFLDLATHSHPWQRFPIEGSWFPEAFIGPMQALQNWADNPDQPAETNVEDAYQTMRLVEAAYLDAESSGTPYPPDNP